MENLTIIPTYSVTLTAAGVHIEGHCGVKEYSADTIAVKTKRKLITITGRKLNIGAMTKSEIFITGVIQDILVEDRGRQR